MGKIDGCDVLIFKEFLFELNFVFVKKILVLCRNLVVLKCILVYCEYMFGVKMSRVFAWRIKLTSKKYYLLSVFMCDDELCLVFK